MGSHVRPAINRSPREKSRTGGAAFASLNRRPRRRRLLTVPRICLRSAMLAASPKRHTNSMRSDRPTAFAARRNVSSVTDGIDGSKAGRAGGGWSSCARPFQAWWSPVFPSPRRVARRRDLRSSSFVVELSCAATACAFSSVPPFSCSRTRVCRWDNSPGPASRRLRRPGRLRVRGRACWAGEDRGLQAEWRRRAVAIPMEMSIAPDWSKTRIRLFGAETFFVSSAM